jgi:hypothetical protein
MEYTANAGPLLAMENNLEMIVHWPELEACRFPLLGHSEHMEIYNFAFSLYVL